jgi:probable HAF family extracellular repeat protein
MDNKKEISVVKKMIFNMPAVGIMVLLTFSMICGPIYAGLYSITGLGTLDGDDSAWENVYASDINDQGVIAGSISTPGPGSDWHSFVWTQENGMQDLGTLGGNSTASSINDSSAVVGTSGTDPLDPGGASHAYLWTSEDGIQDIGTLGGSTSRANDINAFGQVVGQSDISVFPFSQHAFLWEEESGMQDLGTLGGSWSEARGMNDVGDVVGQSRTSGLDAHAFLWDSSNGMVDLGSLGGSSAANAINNLGVVVGYYLLNSNLRAFMWDEINGMIDIGDLGGSTTVAQNINDQGVVVGSSRLLDNSTRAFIWDSTDGLLDLNTLVDAPGWELTSAAAINGKGHIVGHGWHNGLSRSFLLEPVVVPEPSSLGLLAIGLFGLWWVGSRKYIATTDQVNRSGCLTDS